MTLQEKYDMLMEKVADKTKSMGLEVIIEHRAISYSCPWGWEPEWREYWEESEFTNIDGTFFISDRNGVEHIDEISRDWTKIKLVKIIWHPITIWRAIQWWHENKKQMFTDTDEVQNIWLWFIQELFEKRPKNKLDKPIEPTEEFEPVIDFLLTFY